jgi:hypothetical protein
VVAVVLIPVAWFVFWWLYRKWRLPQAQTIHYSGPLMFLAVATYFGGMFVCGEAIAAAQYMDARELPHEVAEGAYIFLKVVLVAAWSGCAVSTLVSFPASIFMLLYLAAPSRHAASSPYPPPE